MKSKPDILGSERNVFDCIGLKFLIKSKYFLLIGKFLYRIKKGGR